MNIPAEIQVRLNTLLRHAAGDTGGSRRCAMFLLSLWNGDDFKVDLQDLMYIDAELFAAMLSVYQYLYGSNQQLDSIVTEKQMQPVLRAWGS